MLQKIVLRAPKEEHLLLVVANAKTATMYPRAQGVRCSYIYTYSSLDIVSKEG